MALNIIDDIREMSETVSFEPDPFIDPEAQSIWILQMTIKDTIVTMRFEFGIDPYLTITNVTVIPENMRGQGIGKIALGLLLEKACRFNLFEIHAVQVQDHVAGFWKQCEFEPIHNTTKDWRLKDAAYDALQTKRSAASAAGDIY